MAGLFILDVTPLLEPEQRERAEAILSQERLRKTERIRPAIGKACSLGAGLLLDYVLRRHNLREKSASRRIGAHGKPEIVELNKSYVNLSHSGNLAVIAEASCEVGVDIQQKREIGAAVRNRISSPGEWEKILKQCPDEELAGLRLWTRKEALLKELGVGIATSIPEKDTFAIPSRVTEFELSRLGFDDYALAVSTLDPSFKTVQPILLTMEDVLS